jgi:hypothetical protein
MEYIVFRNPYTSYGINQSGYFVSYKDKLSDKFSDNWYDAKRYKSLGFAISKLGIIGLESNSIEYFVKLNTNKNSKSLNRDIKISKLFGLSTEKESIEHIIHERGKIQIVENNELKDIDIEVINNFIVDKISKNNIKFNSKFKKSDIPLESSYIDNSDDEDLWNNWAKS